MNILKIALPLLALVGIGLATVAVRQSLRASPAQPPVVEPSATPYLHALSGAGIVEARGENIAVAPALGGIVTEIYVKWGQAVKAGDKLFQVDSAPVASQIAVQEAQVAIQRALVDEAAANLAKLKAEPRAEDAAIFRAKLNQAQAQLDYAQDMWTRVTKANKGGASGGGAGAAYSEDDISARKSALDQTRAGVAAAKADLDKILAGAWDKDIMIAEATLATAKETLRAAESRLVPLKIDLARLTVTTPMEGTVLRINIHPGEYAAAAGVGQASDGAVVLGDIEHLHVRVDIDENDVPRLITGAPAIGYIRGKTDMPITLKFVRIEPFVIPKRNLTGGAAERVDTRVLQVIYVAENQKTPLYVGQQLDVFIRSDKLAAATQP
ncbi:MAG: biotin/lipoyl-binding protein [Phycisphaerae bacterium]